MKNHIKLKNSITSLVTFLLLIFVFTAFPVQAKSDGFKTPEEALQYFVANIRIGDLEGALEAFPIKKAAESYDFELYHSYVTNWSYQLDMPYPSDSELSNAMNRQNLKAVLRNKIFNFMFSFSAAPEFIRYPTVSMNNIRITDLMEASDFNKTENLEIVRIDYCMAKKQPTLQENYVKQAAIYGADFLEDYTVLYSTNGELFWGGIQVIWYGNRCYLWRLNSFLAGSCSEGFVLPVTEDTYLQSVESENFSSIRLISSSINKQFSSMGSLTGFSLFSWNFEKNGFGSPEEALNYYVKAIRNKDLEKAICVFPIVQAATGYDFEAFTHYYHSWALQQPMPCPSQTERSTAMNIQNMTSRFEFKTNQFIFSFSADPVFLTNENVLSDNVDFVTLMKATDFDIIENLEILRIDYANPDRQNEEEVRDSYLKSAAYYGADDLTEYTVLYKTSDHELFWGGMQTLWYGDRCYILNLTSYLSNQKENTYVAPITEEDYLEGIKTGIFPE